MSNPVITLILARHWARHEGECESAAICKTAKRLLGEVKGDAYAFFKALSQHSTPAYKRVEAMNKLEIGMRLEGKL